jgi:predicted ArsR family transcriptional regulator
MMHPLDAIGDRDLRETLLFARAQALPVTADEVAAAQEIHRNVARARLERLVAAGLLTTSFERRTGRSGPGSGRPAKTYRVAPELSAIEFPERHYERLIGLIVDALPERGRHARLRQAGNAFGRELWREAGMRPVKSFRPALERVCTALGRLGYQASVVEVTGEHALLATPTCPLRPLVCADAELAELDRGMWSGLLATALDGGEAADVRCDTGASCRRSGTECHVVLTLSEEAAAAGLI